MTRDEIKALIKKVALSEGIDEALLLAICTVESSLNPLAVKFEPAYKWVESPREWASQIRVKIPGYSVETEEALQRFSYGLGQIMGGVMRQYGYQGLLQNCMDNPETPLIYAAKHLKNFLRRYSVEVEAIAAYNAGSPRKTPGGLFINQTYVDKVDKELRKLRALV